MVVVDFWATFCVPCRKAFPHVVELHQRAGGPGTGGGDRQRGRPRRREGRRGDRQVPQPAGPAITNFLLDEQPEVWTEKLKAKGVPLVFVFNRAGQIEKKYTEAPHPAEFDALLERLLYKKREAAREAERAKPWAAALGRIPSGLFVLTARHGRRGNGHAGQLGAAVLVRPAVISIALRRGSAA